MDPGEWDVYVVDEVREWITSLDPVAHARVVQAIDLLAEAGPGLGRPLVDSIPWRSSILLVAGDKSGRWNDWYRDAIPLAEQRYETYLKERSHEEGERR